MFSFNKKGAIKPIAKVIGGDEDNKILYLHAKDPYSDKIKSGFFDNIELIKNQRFEWFPDVRDDFCDVISIAGKRGSGKSTLGAKFAQEIKDVLELDDDDVIVVKKSHIEDKAFAKLNPLYSYVDETFIDEPLTLDEICKDGRPKVVILDDLDNIQSNKLKKSFINFQDELLKEGRKYNCYVIVIAHRMCAHGETKGILTESTYFCFFPSGLTSDFKYCLNKYADLSLEFIKELKKEKSKWVLIHNESPMFILTEKRATIFDGDREDERLKNKKEEVKEKRLLKRVLLEDKLKR